jgi:hypothetical protein
MSDIIISRLDKARALLAEARDATDATRVADLARAAKVYARRQKLSDEAIRHARAVKVDAMALMGEFLKEAPKNSGTAGNGRPPKGGVQTAPPKNSTPTLKDIGIGKKESSDAQALAGLKGGSPELFEKVRQGEISVARARQEVRREEFRTRTKARPCARAPLGDTLARQRGCLMPNAKARGLVRLDVEGLGEEVWLVNNASEVRRAYEEALARWESQQLWDDPDALAKERSPLDAAADSSWGRVVLRGHAGNDIPPERDANWLEAVTRGCDKATADEVRALAEELWAGG